MKYITARMAEKHENDLQRWLQGRKARGSGNQFNNPADGRQDRYRIRFAFAWDCKSTLRKSISVSKTMWEKLDQQAGGERPLLPLRFYSTESLHSDLDLAVIRMDDLRELVTALEDLQEQLAASPPTGGNPDPAREGNPV